MTCRAEIPGRQRVRRGHLSGDNAPVAPPREWKSLNLFLNLRGNVGENQLADATYAHWSVSRPLKNSVLNTS